MEYGGADFWLFVLVFVVKNAAKSILKESYHIFKSNSEARVLSGEHMVQVMVTGHDKVTISMHCDFATSCLPAVLESRSL